MIHVCAPHLVHPEGLCGGTELGPDRLFIAVPEKRRNDKRKDEKETEDTKGVAYVCGQLLRLLEGVCHPHTHTRTHAHTHTHNYI
jgi:hypothetical protein